MKHNVRKYKTRTFEETEKLGEEFVKQLTAGDIVCLYGQLGSGKTTFVKGVAKGFGIHERVISPTFVLIRQHDISVGSITRLYHIDLYRLDSPDSIKGIGIMDLFHDAHSVVFIEWAEKLGKLLPEKRWDIKFKSGGKGTVRMITIE